MNEGKTKFDDCLSYIETTCRTMKSDKQICALGKDGYANGILAMVRGLRAEFTELSARLFDLEAQEDREIKLDLENKALKCEVEGLKDRLTNCIKDNIVRVHCGFVIPDNKE